MRAHHLATTALAVLALTLGACAKKGSGKGKRENRPGFEKLGSIQDDGPGNQNPPGGTTGETPPNDAEAIDILAACFKIDKAEVAYVVGWDNPTNARTAAQALCDKLTAVKYQDGVSLSAAQAPVD